MVSCIFAVYILTKKCYYPVDVADMITNMQSYSLKTGEDMDSENPVAGDL